MSAPADPGKAPRKWAWYSSICNLGTLMVSVLEYYTGQSWMVLAVDVLVLAGLAFFFKALYDCVQARTWKAFVAFLPALVLQLVILATVGLAVWYFWNKADSAHS